MKPRGAASIADSFEHYKINNSINKYAMTKPACNKNSLTSQLNLYANDTTLLLVTYYHSLSRNNR